MAALNMQTPDLPNQINFAMFEMNASSGFIPKPACMSEQNLKFNPFELNRVENVVGAKFEFVTFPLPHFARSSRPNISGAQLVVPDRDLWPNAFPAL